MMRLDKFIADRTTLSRSAVKEAVKNGMVLINGKSVKDYSVRIDPEKDIIIYNGNELKYRKHTYIMLNKPEEYICSTKDGLSETVMSLVPDNLMVKDLFPAGRLDKDSKGFVFITDDGQLAHKILSPKNHLPKYYLVKLRDVYSRLYEEKFAEGLIIDGDEKCLPAKVAVVDEAGKYALVELHEGKFHQVKRMFEAVENEVIVLFRLQIGGLPINENLKPGECLELFNNQISEMLTEVDFNDVLKDTKKRFWSYLINNNL